MSTVRRAGNVVFGLLQTVREEDEEMYQRVKRTLSEAILDDSVLVAGAAMLGDLEATVQQLRRPRAPPLAPIAVPAGPAVQAAGAGPEALRGLEWSTPADYYTILGKQSGRWGVICGYTSKSKMARWLKEAIPPLPWDWPNTVAYARAALEQFFQDRALTTCVHFDRDDPVRRCVTYSLSAPRRRVQGAAYPRPLYHGTYPQSLWKILGQGGLQDSASEALGQEFSTPGCYVTPDWEYAMESYGWAVQLLEDGIMWRFMLEVESTGAPRKQKQCWGGSELVFPENAVELVRLHVAVNAEVRKGDPRFYRFEPKAELIPQGIPPRPIRLRCYDGQRKLPDPGPSGYIF